MIKINLNYNSTRVVKFISIQTNSNNFFTTRNNLVLTKLSFITELKRNSRPLKNQLYQFLNNSTINKIIANLFTYYSDYFPTHLIDLYSFIFLFGKKYHIFTGLYGQIFFNKTEITFYTQIPSLISKLKIFDREIFILDAEDFSFRAKQPEIFSMRVLQWFNYQHHEESCFNQL
ncbi:hypothetical protein BpHYR1_027786 [Brachionus plicatilis]|uniref:Uncharacterized protein n=1 Tax=Brachionus plicatilis TaxID=10195 RepID=A0A3M7RU86_BRAPC|nr:hypothetical protein BpHYR1_027786 [Brachionus plicatilis]